MGFPSITGAPGSNGGIYALPAIGVSGIGNEETFPLDVVSYGGQLAGTVSVPANSTSQILAAPASPQSWALHSWGCALTSLGAATGCAAAIADTLCPLDEVLVQAVNNFTAFGRPLYGQLSVTAVSVTNSSAVAITFWVRYDRVLTPVLT